MCIRPHAEGKRARRSWELIAVTGIAALAAITVAGIGAAISYSHMFDWARANGESGSNEWRARLFPLSVDGAILVASAIIYTDARAKRRRDWLAYAVGATGIVWSVTANVGHGWVGRPAEVLISAWPPIALAVCVELLLRLIKRGREQAELDARKAEKSVTRQIVKPATPIEVPLPNSPAQALTKTTSITQDMHDAGWAPASYPTARDAMLGYLGKVNADATGAELDRIVGAHFKISDGYGRKIVRDFKAQLAAAAEGATDGTA